MQSKTNEYIVSNTQTYKCRKKYTMNRHINKYADIMIAQWYQDKTYSGSLLCKIHKCIKINIDIITITNGTISLESAFDTSCYLLLSLY